MARTRVYLSGTFDCFHQGHVDLLRRARAHGDAVIVVVDGDAAVEERGGRPCVHRDQERLDVVRACRHVDIALLAESRAMHARLLDHFQPDVILRGDDLMGDALLTRLGISDAFLREREIRLRYEPRLSGISSDLVRDRARRSRVATPA